MTECEIRGCRNLEWKCEDCGRVAGTVKLEDRWINVKDRLPPRKTHATLITDGKRVMSCDFIHWLGEPDEQKSWTWILPHGFKKVTHWMPLPEPPK